MGQDGSVSVAEANPVLVELEHGAGVESRHRGVAVVIGSDGRVHGAWGDPSQVVCVRSAIKPLQALALVESGAFDAFGLGDEELTLACASHNGEPMQVERVRAWLERIGCAEADLACGADAANGCSGKHAGFLTLARHLGTAIADYCELDSPVQRRVMSTLAELADLDLDRLSFSVDLCNAPNFYAPLEQLALAFARLTDPSRAGSHGPAGQRVLDAIARHPLLVAGTGRFCSALAVEAGPNLIAKVGAEGACAVFMRRERRALLVKIDDGADRAAPVACCALLERMGALEPAARKGLQPYCATPFVSSSGEAIGVLRPSALLRG